MTVTPTDGKNYIGHVSVEGMAAQGDAITAANAGNPLNILYNGTTFDRIRNNVEATLLASAARTAVTTAAITNYNHRGFLVVVDVTARAVATTLSLTLQVKDPVSGVYVTFWTITAAIDTADNTYTYYFYPVTTPAGITYTEELNFAPPRTCQLTVTPSDANSVTYSVGIYYIL